MGKGVRDGNNGITYFQSNKLEFQQVVDICESYSYIQYIKYLVFDQ
jgi:hypothetical protein